MYEPHPFPAQDLREVLDGDINSVCHLTFSSLRIVEYPVDVFSHVIDGAYPYFHFTVHFHDFLSDCTSLMYFCL